jgi:deoxyribonuclease-2
MGICTSRPTYHILLKLPHGKQCFHSTGKEWIYEEDLHTILHSWYKDYDQWILYNDETPEHTVGTGAHAKGIVAWNRTTLTWLIHSVPKFPSTFQNRTIAPEQLEYGQSFLYVTMPIRHLHEILTQLFIMHPTVYSSTMPYDMYQSYLPLYKKIMTRCYSITPQICHVAKSPLLHQDIYTDLILPRFGGCLYTETWIRGHACDDTEHCKMVHTIEWKNGVTYTYTKDHSKYGYSDKGWMVVGDMNRMTTQHVRGGGGMILRENILMKEIIHQNL